MITGYFTRNILEKSKQSHVNRIEKMINLKCDKCNSNHFRTIKHYNKMKKNDLFDLDYCNMCWRPMLNNRPDKIEKMKSSLKKIWSSLEKREQMSNTIKSIKDISGDKNPMKNLQTRLKVGKSRSEKMNDVERKKYSEGTKKAWESGKFIGVNNAWNCLWHDYIHSSGETYKVQGTWELKFIKWLDDNKIDFKCHRDKIPYIDDNGNERNYYPDFFIYEWDSYVDVKSDYSFRNQERKFEILKSNNNIILLFKEDLKKLNIKI